SLLTGPVAMASTSPRCAARTASTSVSKAALPLSAETRPGVNLARASSGEGPYTTGSQVARTSAAAAAAATISGPIPAGSPTVSAMRGFMGSGLCFAPERGQVSRSRLPGSGLASTTWQKRPSVGATAVAHATLAPATPVLRARPLARAGLPAACVRLALRVRQLIAEAALQPPARAGQPRRAQVELLPLGHPDRDGLEAGQPRGAAQRTPARAVPAEHPRLVADADLPHLDAHPEGRGQVAHQLAEIHAVV